ncbi:helix-turn-helix domain-containing protein [Streptomyces sp. NPDC001985]|uniref:helix-turn-helix domain-containing protein n=1 Tax=Streptomyces sp. NPDC001985 TaxID=3154406 RepID=UPI00332AC49E
MATATTATAAETVERLKEPVQLYSRGWMLADSTDAYGKGLGFATGAQFWVVGRAGVLGSCPAEVAAAAIAFEPLEEVRKAWDRVPAGLTHYEVALHYRDVITAWGERVLAAVDPGTLRTVDGLGRRIAGAAPDALGALFTGWRRLPAPDGLPGRAALTLHVLRELRGAAHIAAILACRLTPLDAILAATHAPPRTGPGYAERMGHRGPFRDPEEVREQRVEAEELTSAITVPFFSRLTPAELALFGDAVERVCATARDRAAGGAAP